MTNKTKNNDKIISVDIAYNAFLAQEHYNVM